MWNCSLNDTEHMASEIWKMISFFCSEFSAILQCELKKSHPSRFSDIFSQNNWEFLVQILHAYYTFLSMLDYKSLFNYMYLQLWRSYATLSATTQHVFRSMVDIFYSSRATFLT